MSGGCEVTTRPGPTREADLDLLVKVNLVSRGGAVEVKVKVKVKVERDTECGPASEGEALGRPFSVRLRLCVLIYMEVCMGVV